MKTGCVDMLELTEPKVTLLRCQRCLYVWKPKVEAPSFCPNCKLDFRDNVINVYLDMSDENGSFDYIDKGS